MTNDRPHHHGHRQRLRQRFIQHGLDGFADYEVVELLFTLAIPRAEVKKPAKALIARFGNLRGILDASLANLQAVPGIGTVTPVALRIIREAASLYLQQSANSLTHSPTLTHCFVSSGRKSGHYLMRSSRSDISTPVIASCYPGLTTCVCLPWTTLTNEIFTKRKPARPLGQYDNSTARSTPCSTSVLLCRVKRGAAPRGRAEQRTQHA
jgi:NAD-dependent DNA ligase